MATDAGARAAQRCRVRRIRGLALTRFGAADEETTACIARLLHQDAVEARACTPHALAQHAA
jgi:hypothetical protein